jgi:4-diphosphocytidyl-2-C-methyl-D-erythritol kinase
MASLTLEAPAKLNLYLYLTGKRPDGYHLLESLVVFTDLTDRLTITPSDTLSLSVEGEFAEAVGDASSNLVIKAARSLAARSAKNLPGAALHLEKNIPVGAGLGGGSSDAAAALRGLNRFWGLNLSQRDLQYIATSLGADVAMCLNPIPGIMRGIGDEIAPLLPPPPSCWAVLVHPRVPLLTRDVYARARLGDAAPIWRPDMLTASAFIRSLQPTRNHLQRPAIAVDARVAEVLLTLETLQPAPDLVRMSGSGACCFGLFAYADAGKRAEETLARQHPQWWVQCVGFHKG